MIALLRTLHAWTGAILALVLIVIGLSGAALTFKPEFIRLTVPAARAKPASLAQTGAAMDRLEHVHHGELRYVVLASDRLGVHQATFTGERYAYVDAKGDIVAQWRGAQRPEAFVYELHHFLLAGDKGMKVVGGSGLIAAGLAVVGLIIWLPVWKSFSLKLLPRGPRRSELLPVHRNLGVLFALPVMLFCLTGAGMIFYRTTGSLLVKLLPGPAAEEFFPPNDQGDVDWVKALASAQAKFPDATPRAVLWPEGPWDSAKVRMKQPAEWTPDGRTAVLIDPLSGTVQGTIDPQVLGKGYRLNDALYPVHVAAVGGWAWRIVTCLSGLALALLGGFGLWSFLLKPRRRKARP